ncbi:hypothetical protein H6P81_018157 [Aristolochia fimbriata]|uniref:Uncharacterized protein n=1 Tax=Aristolochia fimbriata TaxID=158543 RepID=A0AAV7E104_ARIFI|nr:hypothetical protein H6P81_018157 [Aristolochia fimbriata]
MSALNRRSPASSKALAVLTRSFDENLLRRLKTLDPAEVSFAWLARAVDVLVSTVADADGVISDLKVAGSEKSLAAYLDDSVKVLDVCNSVSAELERLRQGRLLIDFVVHLLRRSGDEEEGDKLVNRARARDSIAEYRTRCGLGRRFDKSVSVIGDLAQGLGSPPKGKISTEEKLLRRTVYAVGAVTVFVLGAAVAVLDASPGPVPAPEVHGDFPWADTLNGLSAAVAGKLRDRFAGETLRGADEAEALEEGVRSVCEVIETETDDVDSRKSVDAVNALETATREFTDRLDQLLNGVNGFFRKVLFTRNAFLQNFRR